MANLRCLSYPRKGRIMKSGRLVALVVGCLLILPGLGSMIGGSLLFFAHTFGRDSSGFFSTDLDRINSLTVAVTTGEIDFTADHGTPNRLIDSLDADIRLRVKNAKSSSGVFIGIGPQIDVDRYLMGVSHDEIWELENGDSPLYRNRSGSDDIELPTAQTFWAASSSGIGTQELVWELESGRWTVVIMNSDGSPGVTADVNVGAKVPFIFPLALILLGVGVLFIAASVTLIVIGAQGVTTASYGSVEPHAVEPGGTNRPSPVTLGAHLDSSLSRWQWLVKWFLAIPHFIVLAFLWIAFVVLTMVAGIMILFNGVYPRGIFDFNVGVLRWTWRVSYYATSGGLGTDRYPPFSLDPDPSYPAHLDIVYPTQLSRSLVLIKWWLLAIPHYLIVGVLLGGTGGAGALGAFALVVGIMLLIQGRYPEGMFDLILGCNRWIFRVLAYVALMTDDYPPFRLDQGGSEPRLVAPGHQEPHI